LKVTLQKPAKAKPGDIVTAIGHPSDFYGFVTAYGINDTCDSKAWCRVYWTSAAARDDFDGITFHLVRELEVVSG
jgi:hypothetical protein|tara:strand:- start:469 stop:693 length:225 start_codon:yes stop_codon:yes gene_type:complete